MWFVPLGSGMQCTLSKRWGGVRGENRQSVPGSEVEVVVRKLITEISSDVSEKNYLGMLGWWEERVRVRLR